MRPTTAVRAVIYLRISEDKTGEELGVDRQRLKARQLAEARGWTVVAEFVDNDRSATKPGKRPEFDLMMDMINGGTIHAVITWAVDRLVRNRHEQLRLYEALEQYSMRLEPVEGSSIDMATASGQLVADILAAQARGEIKLKGARQREANEQRARAGKPASGPVPFGFLPDRVTHHPEQAAAIRAAYGFLLAGGKLAGVARRWNKAGLLSGKISTGRLNTGQPSEWAAEQVKRVLIHPRNAGLREYLGEIVSAATWEPIVEREVYEAAKELLSDPSRRGSTPSPQHLLSSVALCGRCGAPCNAGTARPTYHAYRCRASLGHVARRGDHADDYVTELAIERLSRPDAVNLLPSRQNGIDVAAVREQANTLRAKLENLAAEFADSDDMTPHQFRTANTRIKARLADAEAVLAEAGRVHVLAGIAGVADVRAVWDELDVDQRRAVIDALMTIVFHPTGRGARKFDPTTIDIKWKHEV